MACERRRKQTRASRVEEQEGQWRDVSASVEEEGASCSSQAGKKSKGRINDSVVMKRRLERTEGILLPAMWTAALEDVEREAPY